MKGADYFAPFNFVDYLVMVNRHPIKKYSRCGQCLCLTYELCRAQPSPCKLKGVGDTSTL